MVAAVYEFDHWLAGMRDRAAFSVGDTRDTVSPFAKLQSIASVYFPQFSELIDELESASDHYRVWIHTAAGNRISNSPTELTDGYDEAIKPYVQKRETLLNALQKFARDEFQ